MSEIMCPISDYRNAMDIIRKNDSLCEGLNLYYIAAHLCSEWLSGKNDFLEKLEDMIDAVEESDKSIIYYSKVHDISCSVKNWRENEDYRFYLLKSIECSKDMNLVNNRCDLAKILGSKEALVYLKEAVVNVDNIETEESIQSKTIGYWLSSQCFIDEFILGTDLSQDAYDYKLEEANL